MLPTGEVLGGHVPGGVGTLSRVIGTKGANKADSIGTNTTKGANQLTRADIADIDPDRCYECCDSLADSEGYYGETGLPWCQVHGPEGVGEPA